MNLDKYKKLIEEVEKIDITFRVTIEDEKKRDILAVAFAENIIQPNIDDESISPLLDYLHSLVRIYYIFLFSNTFLNNKLLTEKEMNQFMEDSKIEYDVVS